MPWLIEKSENLFELGVDFSSFFFFRWPELLLIWKVSGYLKNENRDCTKTILNMFNVMDLYGLSVTLPVLSYTVTILS